VLVAGFPVFLKGNWSTSTFFASYIGIPIFIVPIIVWKLVHRTKVSFILFFKKISLSELNILTLTGIIVRPRCYHRSLLWPIARRRSYRPPQAKYLVATYLGLDILRAEKRGRGGRIKKSSYSIPVLQKPL
jgi:hypothetical protein